MSREAMQMALEALESDPISHAGIVSRKQAITALRQALETEQEPREAMKQPEALRLADALDAEFVQGRISNSTGRESAVELRRLALKAEQEPVAWMHNFITGNVITHIPADIGRHPERWTALYKDPTPCKTCESLAMAVMNDQTYHEKVIPKREWVGLTDQEIHEIDGYEEDRKMYRFARYIEAKLLEKNHG